MTIGRSLDCDLWLEDPLLSRHHCRIEPALEGDGWVLIELGSRNGTYLNAKRVRDRRPLNHGDTITLGKTHVKFKASGYVPPRPADPSVAMLIPARARHALSERVPTPHHAADRPLPSPRITSADSTIAPSPGETLTDEHTNSAQKPAASDAPKPLAFTRPPARPIVKPAEDE
jgi:pSer/pThr/pTyr-binding forkhead associated (FHA) protein